LRRKSQHSCRAGRVKNFIRPRKQPTPQLQIVRMILVRQPQRRQPPRVLEFWIERKAVVLHGQRCPMTENLHRAVEISRQRSLEVLPPPRRSWGKAPECKTDRREINPRVQSASAAEPDFLRIEPIKIV